MLSMMNSTEIDPMMRMKFILNLLCGGELFGMVLQQNSSIAIDTNP
jgi:hypothetical protein